MGVGGLMAVFGGRYRQVRLLGAGGMGEVWLALDEELGERPVAIKRMHSRMLADAQDVARFQREMRLAARMQHPNIMTLFTTGTDNGIPFMVLEYLEGQDLGKASWIWNAAEAARVGRDTCAALEYAHGLGVVHRDIKPGNLVPVLIGLNHIGMSEPGISSCAMRICTSAKLWITSLEESSIITGRLTGTCSSFIVTMSSLLAGSL